MVQRYTNKILQIVFHLKSRMPLIKERFQNSASDSEYKYKRPNLQYQDIILYSRITLVLQIWKDAYLIGMSIRRLPNWHERSTLTQLAWAFDTYSIGTSVQRLPKLARVFDTNPNWYECSTLT